MSTQTIQVTVFKSDHTRRESTPGKVIAGTQITAEHAMHMIIHMLSQQSNVGVRIEELLNEHIGIGYEYKYSLPGVDYSTDGTADHYWYWYDFTSTYPAFEHELHLIANMVLQYALANPTLCSYEVYLYTQRVMAARRRSA